MAEEDFMDWETDLCETCHRLGQEVAWNAEGNMREKWLCLGEIMRSEKPANAHEGHNTVRMCTVSNATEKAYTQDWTAFEACRAAFALIAGVSNYLVEHQPKIDDDVKP